MDQTFSLLCSSHTFTCIIYALYDLYIEREGDTLPVRHGLSSDCGQHEHTKHRNFGFSFFKAVFKHFTEFGCYVGPLFSLV